MSNGHDNATRNQRRLNAFDIILLVLIIGAVVWGVIMAINVIPPLTETGAEVSLSYTITVSDIPEEVVDQLSEGQTVYDTETGRTLGTVTKISKSQYGIIGIDQTTGEKIFNEIPGRVNVSVTVSAIAKNKDPGYYVDGVIISCGGEYSFRTATVSLKGTCMTMSDQ